MDSDNEDFYPNRIIEKDFPTAFLDSSGNDFFISSFSERLPNFLDEQFNIVPERSLVSIEIKENENLQPLIQEYSNNINEKNSYYLNRKKERNALNTRKKIHTRICPCNIRARIMKAYFSFLIKFINSIIELIFCNEDNANQYKLKKIIPPKLINKEYIDNIKKEKIIDIISKKISKRYIYGEENENKKKCDKILEKKPILKNIFYKENIEIFRDIFYNNNKKIDLEKYGIEETLILTSQKILYKDFINKIKNKGGKNLEQYLEKIETCIKNLM